MVTHKMNRLYRLTVRQLTALLLAWLLFMPAAPLAASTRKGDKLWNDAHTEEAKGNLDHALQLAEQALEMDPADVGYQLEVRRVRFEAGDMHVKNGQKLRNAGKLSEALAEFEKAYQIDPSSDIANQEIQRTRAMIRRNANATDRPGETAKAKDEDKTLTPAELAHKQSQERTDSLLPVPELRPLNSDPIDLKMTNQAPRVLFETVAKLAGINVLFDPEYATAQTIRAQSIDLSRTTLDQALDQLSIVTKSFWKPLSANTIFVTVDNPNKRREYSEQVVKVFYLSNVTTAQELQEMLTVLRTVVDVQKVFNFTSQNALIVRADADTMSLVEKLIADLDKARPEVIIDVMVMEVNSTHMRNITAAFASTGLTTSAIFAPRPGITTPGIQNNNLGVGTATTTTTGTTATTTTPLNNNQGFGQGFGQGVGSGLPNSTNVPLNALSHISSSDFSITNLPGAALEAVLNDSGTRVLQAPQIRAVDNQKATLKIGQKVPTASGSFQPGVAGVGVSPLVNTQFTYLDVGVNLEVLPKVHENNEVSMHIDLDISQVDNYQNLGGISEPEIGQNKETADVRLRGGEVNLIGGIIQKTDTKSKTGIPGLANIPGLGRLFSGENIENDKNELVIALIPHIVRGPEITESNLRGVASGSATQIKVGHAARTAAPEEKPAAAPAVTPAAAPPVAPPATTPPVAPLATAPPLPGPPATAPRAGPPATAPPFSLPGIASATGPAHISFLPATVDAQLNSSITVTLYGDNINNMASVAAQLRYDPRILRVNNMVAGDLPQRGIAETARAEPSKNILNDSGQADVSVGRGAAGGGISGGGGLVTVVFQAVGRGNTSVSISSLALRNAAGDSIGATTPAPLVVNVK